MNLKKSIILASMTLALCACPLSNGDDVASKIQYPDDTRLVGPQQADAIDDLTSELAKIKKGKIEEVKAKVQKAQADIFSKASREGKPEEIAAALLKFENAEDPRKTMTQTPELIAQYEELKKHCLSDKKCAEAYLPKDDDGKQEPGKPGDKPDKPGDDDGKNVPKAGDRAPKKTILDPTELISKAALTPAQIQDLQNGNFGTIPNDQFNKVFEPGDEILLPIGQSVKHIYRTDKLIFVSNPEEGNRVLKLERVVAKDAENKADKGVTPMAAGDPAFTMTYNGDVRAWGAVPTGDPDNPLVPHMLAGKLQYKVVFNAPDDIRGGGVITNLPYAGNVSNAEGGMSVATSDGKFQLGPVSFEHKAPSAPYDSLGSPTYVSGDGKVTWTQKDGNFLPIGSEGSYQVVLLGEGAEFIAGRATVDKSDILLSGSGTKTP